MTLDQRADRESPMKTVYFHHRHLGLHSAACGAGVTRRHLTPALSSVSCPACFRWAAALVSRQLPAAVDPADRRVARVQCAAKVPVSDAVSMGHS